MLKNYEKDPFGVIHQINISSPTLYDTKYIDDRYHKYPEKCVNMSHLRLGYIIGSIGHIPESILDVGYGSGDFLSACQNIIPQCYGNDITGIEPPKGITFVDNILNQKVEVITFFDVLEHFENINFISQIKCKYLCISVPWCHYYSDEWFENWKHRRPDEHLHHFNENSLNQFFNFHGFEMINYSNLEDTIRKDKEKNILTSIFIKK